MPIIFEKQGAHWHAVPLSGAPGYLHLAPVRFEVAASAGGGDGASLLAHTQHDNDWVLFVRESDRLLHNGQPVAAGMRVLAHKDSLAREGGEAVFFSTEEVARVELFAGTRKVSCPRCRGEILAGQPAVKCPQCGVFHHETADRNCWTYANSCTLCPQPTALDAGLQWSPEEL